MKYLRAVLTFFKKETVLSIAALLALLSSFAVHPSAEYLSYPDYRVLALLFCLMLVVSGFQSIGVFSRLGSLLLKKVHSTRQLALLLTALCFFSAMFITNDVALITFVPFAIMILNMAGQDKLLIPVIVLQTIAANLGSMLTPIGNPQNLYLYSAFSIPAGTFLMTMLPLTALAAVLLTVSVILLKNHPIDIVSAASGIQDGDSARMKPQRKKPLAYSVLFLVCLLCVIRILPWPVMLAILVASVFILDRKLFQQVDYFLLLTFVCFFVFIGNMERIPAVADFLHSFIRGRELLLGTLFSQGISNVPAAILLSGFTDSAVPLLYGVNIGGLGTLIASLASVISYRLYGNQKNAAKGTYLKVFTACNFIFLLLLYPAAMLLLQL